MTRKEPTERPIHWRRNAGLKMGRPLCDSRSRKDGSTPHVANTTCPECRLRLQRLGYFLELLAQDPDAGCVGLLPSEHVAALGHKENA